MYIYIYTCVYISLSLYIYIYIYIYMLSSEPFELSRVGLRMLRARTPFEVWRSTGTRSAARASASTTASASRVRARRGFPPRPIYKLIDRYMLVESFMVDTKSQLFYNTDNE